MGVGDTERILARPTRHIERMFGDGSVLIDGVRYPVFMNVTAKAPTITRVVTTGANWTALATGITKAVKWRICELTGNDIHYAFVAVPGNNFSVAFGWEAQNTSPSAIYIKRPGSVDIDVRLELWQYD